MRKFLMGLTVLAGFVATSSGVSAAPHNVAVALGQPGVETVQYYGDYRRDEWRHREWRRREAFERHRRHEDWRRYRHAEHDRYRYGW